MTFASGIYEGATIDGTATVKEGVTFTSTVTVNGTLNVEGGTFNGPVEFNGSSIANISGGSFTSDRVHGGVTFDYNVTGTISGGTFAFADFTPPKSSSPAAHLRQSKPTAAANSPTCWRRARRITEQVIIRL